MYEAYITTLSGIRKHTNADRLQCVTVFGNNVIIDMNYHDGMKVVYFPVDGQLDEGFARDNNLLRLKDKDGKSVGGYLDPDKRNIKAIRLRGEKSDGLVLPIECLLRYTDISKLKDGDRFNMLGGVQICRKYIPRRNHHAAGSGTKHVNDPMVSYPLFAEHSDTEQLAFNQSAFREGDTIYLTRKLHGTSFRVSNTVEVRKRKRSWIMRKLFPSKGTDSATKEYKIVGGTRRVVIGSREEDYSGMSFRKKYSDMFDGILPKGMTVYGEIVGWVDESTPIMPRCKNSKVKDPEFQRLYGDETIFSYGCEPGENDCYIYRITMTNEDGVVVELPTECTMFWCEMLGVKYVPLLEKFIYTTWDDLQERCNKYLDKPEPIDPTHITEGVVVRIDNRPKFEAYKTKSFTFKVLEGIIKDASDVPDMEEAQEVIS